MKDNGKTRTKVSEHLQKTKERRNELITMLKITTNESEIDKFYKELTDRIHEELILEEILLNWNKNSNKKVKSIDTKCSTYPIKIDYSGNKIEIDTLPNKVFTEIHPNCKLIIHRIEWGLTEFPNKRNIEDIRQAVEQLLKGAEFYFLSTKDSRILTIKGNVQRSTLNYGVALTSEESKVVEIEENDTFEVRFAVPNLEEKALEEHYTFKGEIKLYFDLITFED
jgi:hypothetical protein